MAPEPNVEPVLKPAEPDTRVRADFASIGEFIASPAFDAAVLRASKLGVERAMARDRELGLGGPAAGE